MKIIPPHANLKYKMIDFAPGNKQIMANKLLSRNLIYKTDLCFASALTARNISRVNCPKLAKMVNLNPHNFTKNDHRCYMFSNLAQDNNTF